MLSVKRFLRNFVTTALIAAGLTVAATTFVFAEHKYRAISNSEYNKNISFSSAFMFNEVYSKIKNPNQISDDNRIVYECRDKNDKSFSDICIYDRRTDTITNWTNSPKDNNRDPQISFNGKVIAFKSDRDPDVSGAVYSTNTDKTFNYTGLEIEIIEQISWPNVEKFILSDSGKSITFQAKPKELYKRENPNSDIFYINGDMRDINGNMKEPENVTQNSMDKELIATVGDRYFIFMYESNDYKRFAIKDLLDKNGININMERTQNEDAQNAFAILSQAMAE